MKNLLEHIKCDWYLWSSEPEIRILEKYAEEGRKLTLLYTGKYFKLNIFSNFRTTLSNPKPTISCRFLVDKSVFENEIAV